MDKFQDHYGKSEAALAAARDRHDEGDTADRDYLIVMSLAESQLAQAAAAVALAAVIQEAAVRTDAARLTARFYDEQRGAHRSAPHSGALPPMVIKCPVCYHGAAAHVGETGCVGRTGCECTHSYSDVMAMAS